MSCCLLVEKLRQHQAKGKNTMNYNQDDAYHTDHRVTAGNREDWYDSIDTNSMTAVVILWDDEDQEEEVTVCIKMEVCPTCRGRGTHVNPSIDAGGLSSSDFIEDPDFARDYFKGTYNVQCYECHGANVVPVMDEEYTKKELAKRVWEKRREEAMYAAEVAAERRMGC